MSITDFSGPALQIQGLTKHYPIPRQKTKRVAVNDLSFDVPAGEIFGFLGPNGAGKTTTIKMLLGFVAPTRGTARIFGASIQDDSARSQVGYVPEQPYFPKFLTTREIVCAHASLAGLPGAQARERADQALRDIGMADHRHTPLAKLSKGMTQRIALASALVGDPQLLILDEPSSGLDPVGRKDLRDLILSLKAQGKTIFLSSHLLSEMEHVCDSVAILSSGRLAACGRPSDIVRSGDAVNVAFSGVRDEHGPLLRRLRELGAVVDDQPGPDQHATVDAQSVYPALDLLQRGGLRLTEVAPQKETLEDAFLRLVRHDQQEKAA